MSDQLKNTTSAIDSIDFIIEALSKMIQSMTDASVKGASVKGWISLACADLHVAKCELMRNIKTDELINAENTRQTDESGVDRARLRVALRIMREVHDNQVYGAADHHLCAALIELEHCIGMMVTYIKEGTCPTSKPE